MKRFVADLYRMHGEGTYTDANGDMWRGTFYANAGPGLNPFIK